MIVPCWGEIREIGEIGEMGVKEIKSRDSLVYYLGKVR